MIRRPLTAAVAVFVCTLCVLAAFAWERLKEPSPQFHFVDLAHSFLRGRLDTDTPRRHKRDAEKDVSAPRGYYDAIARQTTNPDGSPRGWNDWASYRVLELKGGETLKGVFPWKGEKDDRRKEFHSLTGDLYSIDCRKDVKAGCHGNKPDHLKYYISFPPFPAVLMMPLAKIWGYDVNDVWFTLFFGALNGLLLFLLLQRLTANGHSSRSRGDNLWLTALFVFGTVHFFSSVRGEVWFTALIVGVTLNLAAIACAIDLKRPLLAGLFVGLGLATRTPLVFSSLFILFIVVFNARGQSAPQWGKAVGRMALFAVPVAACLGAIMTYNYMRFENVFEFGHTYLAEGTRHSVRTHGLMSGWFLGPNLSAALINPPVITFEGGPIIRITRHGLGLLWTTPALLLLFKSPRRSPLFKALVCTAFVVALPGLFYQNTGWEQFGYRFGLDWLPFLVIALAVGDAPLTRGAKALILVSIAVNAFGAVTFGRTGGIYY